jgi:hypothetical protein
MVKVKKRSIRLVVLLGCLATFLTGCLYPDEMKSDSQASIRESILLVQNAVDTYKQRTGVLPIKNFDHNTPLYEKYVLDMRKLKEGQYITQLPGVAYENGGNFIFVLVNPDVKPEVRLIDLLTYQQTGDIQKQVDTFKASNQGLLPLGAEVAPHFYQLDFGKLGMKQAQAESRYSRQYLSFAIHESGQVLIDYSPDIMKFITDKGLSSTLDSSTDLRTILVKEAPFVPAKSFPYYWKSGQPVLSE